MIFLPNNEHAENSTQALAAHLAGELAAWSGAADLSDAGQMEELAAAVADFVEETAGADHVDSTYLVMLSYKALQALGETRAAHRMLVFGAGLVRPAFWEVTGGDAMWVLDLREITVATGVSLELLFFRSLTAILDVLAEVWDATSGRGVLGLRHLSAAGAAILGSDDARRVTGISRDIRGMCADKLAQLGRDRSWTDAPMVMDLDLFN